MSQLNKTMKPLRTKLLINNVLTVLISFLVFGVLLGYAMFRLSAGLERFSSERTQAEKANLGSISSENIGRVREIYGAALESKGLKLLKKDSASLVGMIEDNSFSELRRFLEKTFNDDGEIIQASFFTAERSEIKAWAFHSRQYPKGLELPIEYQRATSSWKAKDVTGRLVFVWDPEILRLLSVNGPVVKLGKLELADAAGHTVPTLVYDCVIPIFRRGSLPADIAQARKRHESIGYLRYVLSLERMERTIQDEKAALEAGLQRAQAQSELAAGLGRKELRALVSKILILMLIGMGFVLVLAYVFSWISSSRVTRPVLQLTHVAERMAAGEYQQPISVESDDELGILAGAFREMGVAITRRDDEIRKAERQLAEIFGAVPVGILSIGAGGLVQDKYSGYTEWLLGSQKISGESISALLFSKSAEPFSPGASEAIAGLPGAFGKPEINWEMIKFFLPSEIHFVLPPKHPDKDHYFGLIYQPIFQEGALVRLLVVLEDRTGVMRAQLEIKEANLHKDKSVLRLMQLRKARPDTLGQIMNEIATLIERFGRAVVGKDEGQVRMALHSVKGNTRILGLTFLTDLIHGFEMKNAVNEVDHRAFNWSSAQEAAKAIQEEWRESWALFQAVSGGHGPALGAPADGGAVPLASLENVIRQRTLESARLLKKEVDVHFVSSPGIALSTSASQAFSEVLLHLINNSLSHGLVSGEKRGQISIAVTELNQVITCDLADDGSGINVEAVKASAVAKGLITPAQAEVMPTEQALDLVFATGVSVKQRPDQVSGMGIGLGSVRSRLEAVGGTIHVAETSSLGTRFVFTMRI